MTARGRQLPVDTIRDSRSEEYVTRENKQKKKKKMFSKKSQTDVKKSAHKISDAKKDTSTRFKHLKFLLGTYYCVTVITIRCVHASGFFFST